MLRSALSTMFMVAGVGLALPPLAAGQVVTPDVSRELQVARAVLNAPEVKAALSYVDRSDDETVQEWLSICNAYGPSAPQTRSAQNGYGNELRRSRLLYKLFRIYGLERVHIDDALNVIGVRPGVGGGPTVVLNAHHDNVALWPDDQPVEGFVADGRVWCPAAADDLMGVTQLLTVVRAMNAANLRTRGDVWFVSFTGEEQGSSGASQFVQENYPQNLDWRKGDILVQFHGGGGEGVTTGSDPFIHFTQLRVFVPLDFMRWRTDAVDALAPIMARVNAELRDPRSLTVSEYETGEGTLTADLLYLNMSMVQGNVIYNGTSSEASIRFDLRAPTEERLMQADRDIAKIAGEVTREMGPGFSYVYEVSTRLGSKGVDGWDKANNAAARMAVAASQALYGTQPVIDATRGCGDCRRAYMDGMPAMSLRGNVVDYGEGGRFELQRSRGLRSEVRRRSSGHDVTESGEINALWSGAKHGLVFALAYAGLVR